MPRAGVWIVSNIPKKPPMLVDAVLYEDAIA